ncbi:MAG: hypothetical protein HFH45_03575 [Bacilli bacterium]|nr:hypothetical protein [Bacilli bacterium]
MENKITKFLLTDNSDNNYTDLIIFDKPVDINDLYEVINKVTIKLEGIYTNEDIYKGIDELNVNYNIIDLFDVEQIYY